MSATIKAPQLIAAASSARGRPANHDWHHMSDHNLSEDCDASGPWRRARVEGMFIGQIDPMQAGFDATEYLCWPAATSERKCCEA